ncbi:MAG: HPr family phosphocarrier protein [Planctomycetota bacterium]
MTTPFVQKLPAFATIDAGVFRGLVDTRSARLLMLAHSLATCAMDRSVLTRPLLASLLAEAGPLRELFDAYGALHNRRWYAFRQLVDGIHLFAEVSYTILHIQISLPNYHLIQAEGDFNQATRDALRFTGNVLMLIAARLLEEATRQDLSLPAASPEPETFAEDLPRGFLPRDRTSRHVTTAEETVAHLATAFLNLAAESKFLHSPSRLAHENSASCVPDPISEESLRQIEHRFQNLRSAYDTYISDTDTEEQDPDLKVLRGHVSVIFHLLEIATRLVHYYERHVRASSDDTQRIQRPLLHPGALLEVAMHYAILYASRYLLSARSLCQGMLKRYAEVGSITVPVPRYRGFHVRPSTLVARIVSHYASDVRMELGGESYDASAPLELFRANEQINAEKRRRLAQEIARVQEALPPALKDRTVAAVRWIALALAQANKIVIYEQPLPLEEMENDSCETLSQIAVDDIARLLAMGKIDIESDLTATFTGDKRVLADLQRLAKGGYGEDRFGNNVPLPNELQYLRF